MAYEIAKEGDCIVCDDMCDNRSVHVHLRKSDITGEYRGATACRDASLESTLERGMLPRDAEAKRRRRRSKVCLNKMSAGVWQAKEINQAPLCVRGKSTLHLN